MYSSGESQTVAETDNLPQTTPDLNEVYYIRHLIPKDWQYMSKGGKKFKYPVFARGGLPVVVDEQDNIVLMPHFRVASRDARISGLVKFRPVRNMDDLLHQYTTHHHV